MFESPSRIDGNLDADAGVKQTVQTGNVERSGLTPTDRGTATTLATIELALREMRIKEGYPAQAKAILPPRLDYTSS